MIKLPDTNAERQQRHKRHVDGHHELCRDPERCAATDRATPPGPVTLAVLQMIDAGPVRDPADPRGPLLAAVTRLGEAIDAGRGPAGPLVRELRSSLSFVNDFGVEANRLDDLRTRRSMRQISYLLDGIAAPTQPGISTGTTNRTPNGRTP